MRIYDGKLHLNEWIGKGVQYAVFDVDNTITRSNIVHFYLFVKRKRISNPIVWSVFFISFLAAVPYYFMLDVLSRDLFNRLFVQRKFRNYQYDLLEMLSEQYFNEKLKGRFIAPVHDLIKALGEKDIKVTLLSTNFDLIVKQYADYFRVQYRCLPVIRTGNGIGIDFSELNGFKGNRIKEFDASVTIAVGDSKYDLPMLEHVHYPVIVAKKQKKWMSSIQREAVLIKA